MLKMTNLLNKKYKDEEINYFITVIVTMSLHLTSFIFSINHCKPVKKFY